MLCSFLLYSNMSRPYVYVNTFPLEIPSTTPHFTPRGHHRAPSWAHWAVWQFPLAICFAPGSIYVSATLNSSHPLLPTPCPKVQSLCLHLRFSSFKPGNFRMYSIVHQYFPMKLQRITADKHGSVSKTFPSSVPHPHHVAEKWFLLSELSSLAPCCVRPSSAVSLQEEEKVKISLQV